MIGDPVPDLSAQINAPAVAMSFFASNSKGQALGTAGSFVPVGAGSIWIQGYQGVLSCFPIPNSCWDFPSSMNPVDINNNGLVAFNVNGGAYLTLFGSGPTSSGSGLGTLVMQLMSQQLLNSLGLPQNPTGALFIHGIDDYDRAFVSTSSGGLYILNPVPEPSTILLFATAVGIFTMRRRITSRP